MGQNAKNCRQKGNVKTGQKTQIQEKSGTQSHRNKDKLVKRGENKDLILYREGRE